ncbi:unnamed protein product [Polarella glacialis]|uniref:50S ribosomal protein L9, chloroplastic n=1 Tax=Polarella glacialis TaxID=89957 RepID=A0A813FVR3_POLGL|nr:unnamed protein product [Polarella glacialis]|eukprot:CAMPEP_0115090062 /NCGR_PEP_ID=MMETSP0227-20121206/25147_1 /TAXON_ID=89957 /ORGANISM="Polarella glacialis, Strain CCMP 1383" /LENGTH=229 /DNA_ID=CAMNT_0002481019 /DNA_START=49 /DNA_END=738 /DNA_ORIENTATION=-
MEMAPSASANMVCVFAPASGAARRLSPRRVRLATVSVLAMALLGCILVLVGAEGGGFEAMGRTRATKRKLSIVLMKDDKFLGKTGDIIKVKRGHFRNWLFPHGIAKKQDTTIMKQLEQKDKDQKIVITKMYTDAMEKKQKIEGHGVWIFPKKVREGTNKIYGSLTAINVAEEIVKATAIPIRITSVEIPKVTELGEYTGTVELADEVTAYVKIKVVAEGFVEGEEPPAE